MKKIKTDLLDCYILENKRFGDDRGYFESVTLNDLEELGFKKIFQVSNSLSNKGIVRGLHFQLNPYCQAKVVRCHRGAVLDVVVDIRKDSETYGKSICVELTPENGRILYVPRGFAHGFISLKDDTLFEYYVDNQYKPRLESGILWNDPCLNINWEEIFNKYDIKKPILSEKDLNRMTLNEFNSTFTRKKKKYLITGIGGQLGYDIKRELILRGEENILALSSSEMDITNRDKVMEVVNLFKPDVIFHCAAWTAVDKAEIEKDSVMNVNYIGTKNIVDASLEVGAKIVYVSTDYVFDGKKDIHECYNEEGKTNPMSVYGESKLLGELETRRNPKHYIARVSWVFGLNGNNFIKTMLKLSDLKEELDVVCDQIGSPTYTVDLAKILVEMIFTDKYGTYNVTNEGYCSWADLAKYVMEHNNKTTKINYVTTSEYQKKCMFEQAYRPLNSRLSKDKLILNGFEKLPSWEDAVNRYCKELDDSKILRLRK